MKSSFAAGLMSASLLLAGVGETAAQQPPSPASVVGPQIEPAQSVSDLILPYSPYVFDAAVALGRSFAEITYGSRRYDPITRTLVVTGLKIRRDGFQMRVGQARIGAEEAIYDDVAVDTRALPLDPTTREVLKRLGREILTGDVAVNVRMDAAAANYQAEVAVRIEGAGRLELSADLLGFHVLVPLQDLGGKNAPPEFAGSLRSASARFTDAGLASALYDVLGRNQGLSGAQARATASMMAGIGIAAMFDEMPGNDRPQLQQRAREWSAAVQAFLTNPDQIALALTPAQPFDLSRISAGEPIDARTVLALNPSLTTGSAPKLALRDPASLDAAPDAPLDKVLAAAEMLVDGRGVPQDIGRAVVLLIPAAQADNRAAIALLARALALDPRIELPQDSIAGVYAALILAKADGLAASDESLAALRGRLSPVEVAAAEDEAAGRWKETPVGTAQRQGEVRAFQAHDWPAVRRLAFAYYEGV